MVAWRLRRDIARQRDQPGARRGLAGLRTTVAPAPTPAIRLCHIILIYLSDRYETKVIFKIDQRVPRRHKNPGGDSTWSRRRCDFQLLSFAGGALYSLRIALNTQGFPGRQLVRRHSRFALQ
jgi:hypothetical protein